MFFVHGRPKIKKNLAEAQHWSDPVSLKMPRSAQIPNRDFLYLFNRLLLPCQYGKEQNSIRMFHLGTIIAILPWSDLETWHKAVNTNCRVWKKFAFWRNHGASNEINFAPWKHQHTVAAALSTGLFVPCLESSVSVGSVASAVLTMFSL